MHVSVALDALVASSSVADPFASHSEFDFSMVPSYWLVLSFAVPH